MAIGERVKLARRLARLNQRDLAARVGVSAQAISKYERGLDTPSSGVLLRLGEALGVGLEFFFRRPRQVGELEPVYHVCAERGRRARERALGGVQGWLEQYLELEDLVDRGAGGFSMPSGFPRKVGALAQVERSAEELRQVWQLGFDPIRNLIEVLEDQGIKVRPVPGAERLDSCALSGRIDGGVVVFVAHQGEPGDRQRFKLAHALAQLVLRTGEEFDPEQVTNRFARAFLAPERAVCQELGGARQSFMLAELYFLKHKYGLSMQDWIDRAEELGIVSSGTARRALRCFKARGWCQQEPGEPYPAEVPRRQDRLLLQALAEDLISEGRAAELIGKPVPAYLSDLTAEHGGLPAGLRLG